MNRTKTKDRTCITSLPLSPDERAVAQRVADYHGISLSGLLRSLVVREAERINSLQRAGA